VPVIGQELGDRLLVGGDGGGRLLDVEIQDDVGEGLEHLGQRGDPELRVRLGPAPVRVGRLGLAGGDVSPRDEPVRGVERLDLREGEIGDGTGAVGGAIDRRVVTDHDVAVGGAVRVELERVGARRDGAAHGEERGRRPLPCPALVGVREDAPFEPRVGVGHGSNRTDAGRAHPGRASLDPP
jgi:hypothetical protein